ncbi:MAG: hypothetical protein K2Z81_14255 [Cyanobacteria bacterium]|nr:hypothetical protein [Cyanobacteriota bacterium]
MASKYTYNLQEETTSGDRERKKSQEQSVTKDQGDRKSEVKRSGCQSGVCELTWKPARS